MQPIKIKVEEEKLKIEWDNNSQSQINLKHLRDECPCANCKGETILFKTFKPVQIDSVSPNKYKIVSMEVVGNYALQITWGDGHNTGVYSWDYLKELAEDDEEKSSPKDYKPLI